jgi:hypothetical protein
MKARLFNFYLDNIQPRLATGKARLVQIKQRLIAGLDHRRWWARTGLVVANVALVLLLHWPTFSPYQHALGRLVMLLPPGAALLYFLGRLVPARTRQRMTAWFSRPGLPGTAGLAIALVAGASLTYLWLTWPAWQAGVQGGLVHVGLLLTGLWAFLKTPLQRSRLILVTPHPFPQDDMPVPAGDGRLL